MKFILSVINAIALLLVVRCEPNLSEYCHQHASSCQLSTGATDTDVDEMCDDVLKSPTTETGKCLFDCLLRESNLMTDEGFQVTQYMDLVKDVLDEIVPLEVVEEVVNKCNNKKDATNRCETSLYIFECIRESFANKGV